MSSVRSYLKLVLSMPKDPATEEVTIGPGATLSSVNVYLLRLGRMTPNGVAPATGCGGLCTQGGLGWLLHRFGLSVDNITKMNLILADGTVKDLDFKSEGEDKELFFAARGCAGSLGITTSFTMKTYPMEMVTGGLWLMLDDDSYTGTGKLIRLLREIAEEQESDSGTRTLFGGIYCMSVPPEEFIPEEHHGKPCTGVLIASWGEDKAALGLVSQFVDREIVFGQPPAPMPFNIFNQLLSGPFLAFPPLAVYWKGAFTDSLQDDRIDNMLQLWSTHEPWLNASFVGIEFQGGVAGIRHAENLLGEDDHSVSGLRHFRFAFPFLMYFPPGNNEFFEKAQTMCRSLAGVWSDTNVTMYANYLADVGETAEEKKNESGLILGDRLSRVSAVKAKVDPNNIFYRSVLNISS